MSNWCAYEWCVEEYDQDPDHEDAEIVDLNFSDKLWDLRWLLEKNERHVLVRDSEQGKLWAYVDPISPRQDRRLRR